MGSQSENQSGKNISSVHDQPRAMQESILLALIIGRALDSYNTPKPLEASTSGEIILELKLDSKGQIDDPGSGSSKDTLAIEPEVSTTSVEIPQFTPQVVERPTTLEAGESSRGKGKAPDSVRLVTCWFSPYAHRVAISLREKGVQYVAIEESTLNKNDRTLNANPFHKEKIPILMHRGRVVSESRIIMEYIDEAWPDSSSALLPVDPFERSAVRYWSEYIDKKITQRLLQHIGVNIKEVYDTVNDALIGLNNAMTVISHGNFFMGDRLGFVDIMFAPMIPWFYALHKLDKYTIPDAMKCPRLHQWLLALHRHPSVTPSLEDCNEKKLRTFIVKHFRESRKQ
ncbi:unnamed protein product [Calypogeia fissa]